ncbi:MAG: hypothetical protein IH940_09685 [Acidobacteria bacterium]|nr:hypothetical protein [Acidobacteriota bacterium]
MWTQFTIAGSGYEFHDTPVPARVGLHAVGDQGLLEDRVEDLFADAADQDLGRDAAEEGVIAEGRRREVGRKHDPDLKWHFERDTEQRQIVDASVERHNPPIQHLFGRHGLAAKVVDHEEAVVGFHLKRRCL